MRMVEVMERGYERKRNNDFFVERRNTTPVYMCICAGVNTCWEWYSQTEANNNRGLGKRGAGFFFSSFLGGGALVPALFNKFECSG